MQNLTALIYQSGHQVGAAYVNSNIHCLPFSLFHEFFEVLVHLSGQLQSRVVAHLPVTVVDGRHLHDAGQVPARPHRMVTQGSPRP